MPTYDYECSACGHEFEAIQSLSEARLTKCPKCKKAKLQRLIGSGSGIIFKGTGFYQTDYKNKSGASAKPGTDMKQKESKSDAKPAAAPSPKPGGSGGCGSGCGCH